MEPKNEKLNFKPHSFIQQTFYYLQLEILYLECLIWSHTSLQVLAQVLS